MNSQTAKSRLAGESAIPASAELHGRRLLAARIGWLALSLLIVGMFVVAIPARYEQIVTLSNLPEGIDPAVMRANLTDTGLSAGFYATYRLATEVGFAVACVTLAAGIFWRRSDEWMALFVALLLVLLGTTFWNTIGALALYHPAWLWAGESLGVVGKMSLFLFFYLFPDGRFVPRWTRYVAAALVAGVVSEIFFMDSPFAVSNWPVPLFLMFMMGWLLTGVFAQVYRYRRVSGPVQRQQTKWVVFGFVAALGGFLAVILVGEVLFSLVEPGTPGELVGTTLITLFMLLIPLSIAVAILRYRLFDIDLIINRTLVYGALTACVVGIYVVVVGYLGTLFQTESNLPISLVATGLVAVLFAPLRDFLQRGVNRLMYGERDDPYAVLSRLGQRMEATLVPGGVLPSIVETVAAALKVPYAAIALKRGEGFETVAERGMSVEEPVVLPLTYGPETVGRLILAPRSPGESFGTQDLRLLEDLARQIGVAAHAVRLTADLQRSRERLVTAREEERRRLRRDLHDGVGPQLAALTLKLETARNVLSHDPTTAALLSELAERARATVSDVRRAVHALRPPALDELGLVPALRESAAQYTQNGPHVTVAAPENLPPLPAAVEVAAYRIALEAMTNVVRHADAENCEVRISPDETAGVLRLEVVDDGRGIDAERGTGVGLHSMRERAEELGGSCVVESPPEGGTRVSARLPLGTRLEEG